MNRITCLFLFFVFFLLTSCTHQVVKKRPVESQSYQILFDGRKVGTFTESIYFNNEKFETIQKLEIKSQFKGMKPIVTRIIEIHEESADGKAIKFMKFYETPLAKREIIAESTGDQWKWHERRGKHSRSGSIDMPPDFLLNRALKFRMREAIKNRDAVTYHSWNIKDKQFQKTEISAKSFDPDKNAWLVSQNSSENPEAITSEYWVDKNFQILAIEKIILGKTFQLLHCNQDCENVSFESLRPLDYQMLASPYRIPEEALGGKIRYFVQMHSADSPPNTADQKVTRLEQGWKLDVCNNCSTNNKMHENDNVSLYLQETDWMENSDPAIIRMVKLRTKKYSNNEDKMQALVVATRKRLEPNLEFSGYATASQAFHSRSGDCTEYALLLATMGRIAKIPTRIVFGLSYSRDYFHGKKHMFVPHAWVQAFVNGEWKSYDAGLGQFDAGHIALKISNGSERDFVEMFDHFSDLKIISAQQIVNIKPVN